MAIKVENAWADDVAALVSLEGTELMIYEDPHGLERAKHGFVTKGSFKVTIAEAEALAAQLLDAARISRELDESMNELERKE